MRRLVAGMYETGGDILLGTAISGPIRVLANNDVPTGAAYIPLVLTANSSWEGWSSNCEARMHPGVERVERELTFTAVAMHREGSRSLSSNETDYNLADNGTSPHPPPPPPTPPALRSCFLNYRRGLPEGIISLVCVGEALILD